MAVVEIKPCSIGWLATLGDRQVIGRSLEEVRRRLHAEGAELSIALPERVTDALEARSAALERQRAATEDVERATAHALSALDEAELHLSVRDRATLLGVSPASVHRRQRNAATPAAEPPDPSPLDTELAREARLCVERLRLAAQRSSRANSVSRRNTRSGGAGSSG